MIAVLDAVLAPAPHVRPPVRSDEFSRIRNDMVIFRKADRVSALSAFAAFSA
ncbi:hypothetical protein [Erythrobacter donghaensis]|jgi:hypothetical protein|nr:hypothetical protein [Erythrobacter donghaensis]